MNCDECSHPANYILIRICEQAHLEDLPLCENDLQTWLSRYPGWICTQNVNKPNISWQPEQCAHEIADFDILHITEAAPNYKPQRR